MANTSTVTFLNQPKLSGHITDKELNEVRVILAPKIEGFIESNPLFQNKNVSVSFPTGGVSSLVALLSTDSDKYILKMKLRPSDTNMEASFLKKWASIIKVPHIYEYGKIDGYNYTLMEYIEADTLAQAYTEEELIEKNIFFSMGQTLRKMHNLEAQGFGLWTEDEVAKYATFSDWLTHDKYVNNQKAYVKEHNLLPIEVYGSIDEIINTMVNYVDKDNRSTYCHFDFSPYNIFNTGPITVFDPVCVVNHPYIDLSKSIIQTLDQYADPRVSEQIIEGYFSADRGIYDRAVLKNFLIFIAYTKFPIFHKKNKMQSIENVKNYLMGF